MERFIKNLAKGAGAILREGFGRKLRIAQKSELYWDVVTQYDLAAEKSIISKIRKKYPTHGILTEENGHIIKARNFWLIDPLDATHAFTRGLPQFSVSIAFIGNSQIRMGVVYDPVRDELFFGQKGKGAFLNNKRIFVFPRDDLNYAMVSVIMGSAKTTKEERKAIFRIAIQYGLWLSRVESTALTGAYVAAGRYDAVLSKNLEPWDYAAAGLILKEAGAKVTDFEGKPYRWNSPEIVAANPVLHKKIIRELKA